MLPKIGEAGYYVEYNGIDYILKKGTIEHLFGIEVYMRHEEGWCFYMDKSKVTDLPESAFRTERDELNNMKKDINKRLKALAKAEERTKSHVEVSL